MRRTDQAAVLHDGPGDLLTAQPQMGSTLGTDVGGVVTERIADLSDRQVDVIREGGLINLKRKELNS